MSETGVDALFLETETRLIRNREVLERAAKRIRATGNVEGPPAAGNTDAAEQVRIADTARRMRSTATRSRASSRQAGWASRFASCSRLVALT